MCVQFLDHVCVPNSRPRARRRSGNAQQPPPIHILSSLHPANHFPTIRCSRPLTTNGSADQDAAVDDEEFADEGEPGDESYAE